MYMFAHGLYIWLPGPAVDGGTMGERTDLERRI
jgi:hypothetical protein